MRHQAGRIPTLETAFSLDLRTKGKHPREQCRDHLKFVRTLPCLICGSRRNTQAAHLRTPNAVYAKRMPGVGEKPDDKWSLPLCPAHHEEQHRGNEMAFWQRHGIPDPFALALTIYGHTGDEEAVELVIKLARQSAADEH